MTSQASKKATVTGCSTNLIRHFEWLRNRTVHPYAEEPQMDDDDGWVMIPRCSKDHLSTLSLDLAKTTLVLAGDSTVHAVMPIPMATAATVIIISPLLAILPYSTKRVLEACFDLVAYVFMASLSSLVEQLTTRGIRAAALSAHLAAKITKFLVNKFLRFRLPGFNLYSASTIRTFDKPSRRSRKSHRCHGQAF